MKKNNHIKQHQWRRAQVPNRTRVLLGLAQCVSIGSTVLEVIFPSFCEAILALIIPKHEGHAFTFFRENFDLIASNQF